MKSNPVFKIKFGCISGRYRWFSHKRRKIHVQNNFLGNNTTPGMATMDPSKKPCAESMQPQPLTPHKAHP